MNPQLLRLIRIRRKQRKAQGDQLTAGAAGPLLECHPSLGLTGLVNFCERYCKIQERRARDPAAEAAATMVLADLLGGVEIPFVLFAGQLRVAAVLVDGLWPIVLKGRQIGLTWLMVAYVLWRFVYSDYYTVVVLNQERMYAEDFLRRLRWMNDRLPRCFRLTWTTERRNPGEMACERDGKNLSVRSVVGSDKAARSLTADLIFWDEASRVPDLAESFGAAAPTVVTTGGQLVLLTTSAGPGDEFHGIWTSTNGGTGIDQGGVLDGRGRGPTGLVPMFLGWWERPGRDAAWKAAEKARLDAISPLLVKREYPDTPEEAFEYAGGRVYPLFTTARCVGEVELTPATLRYRAVDWGQSQSAYVCLWIAHIPGKPGFLVSRKCPQTIREFLAYRRDETTHEPLKEDDHTCDAVRYAVSTFGLSGCVYVYREVYRPHSVDLGWTLEREIREIHELSGWSPAPAASRRYWLRGTKGERYQGTVADRSLSKAILELNTKDIPCIGQKIFRRRTAGGVERDPVLTEKEEGIRMVSALIDGSEAIDKMVAVTRESVALESLRRSQHSRVPHTVSIIERQMQRMARELLQRRGEER